LFFCLRWTGGDRISCRIVAYYLGMPVDIIARIASEKCTGDQHLQRPIATGLPSNCNPVAHMDQAS
jgi:hypothetical protein